MNLFQYSPIIYFNRAESKLKVYYIDFIYFICMQTPLKKTFDNPEYLSRSRKYDHKCVCDICNCGKHKCPDKAVKFEGKTTNSQFYKPYNILPQRREQVQPKPISTHYDPHLMQTNYNTNYTPHKIQKQKPIIQKNGLGLPTSKFEGESEYKKNYSPIRGKTERIYTSPSKQYIPNTAIFDGTTTYNREFSPKKADINASFKRSDNYQPSTTPFQGETAYGRDFKPHKIQINRPITPNQSRYTPTNTKFQGNSRYREFYQPYKIEPKQRCPTEYLPQRPSNCSPGKEHLNFSAEKNGWE